MKPREAFVSKTRVTGQWCVRLYSTTGEVYAGTVKALSRADAIDKAMEAYEGKR